VGLRKKYVPASVHETAFNCPHCGALTSQSWYHLRVVKTKTPWLPNDDDDVVTTVRKDTQLDDVTKKRFLGLIDNINSGLVFFHEVDDRYLSTEAGNLFISECFNCQKLAVWVHDRLLFPPERHGEEPIEDLPPEILRDYEEARSILNLSPRGAAALLRLAIQRLVKHLGENGDNINDDIASLVKKGLSPLVQKALDVVRVVGNEAVHPGVLDLRDGRDVALQIFRLVNLIAEQMISHPKHVNELFDNLPDSKKEQIKKRDAKP
jgi:hypothetical protein